MQALKQDPIRKIMKAKGAEGVALPSNCEALSSNPSTSKKKSPSKNAKLKNRSSTFTSCTEFQEEESFI
jgi:hypothetical protein